VVLIYGSGSTPLVNITDENDMAVPAFGPVASRSNQMHPSGAGRPTPLGCMHILQESVGSGNDADVAGRRLVEAELEQLEAVVVVVPKVLEKLLEVEDPQIAKLEVPGIANPAQVRV